MVPPVIASATPLISSGAAASPAAPATLLWIGPTGHREFAAAYRYCRDHVGQIAVRRGLGEAIRRPAGYTGRIIFARPTRQVPSPRLWHAFARCYPEVASLALCGSLCDGEGRTGEPWPGGEKLRFSRWWERLPTWLEPCGVPARGDTARAGGDTARAGGVSGDTARGSGALWVLCDRFEMAEPFLQWAERQGWYGGWHRRFLPAVHRGGGTVLWDDSVARPAAAAAWRERLSPSTGSYRHLWLALQPSAAEIDAALQGGVRRVLSKPATLAAIVASDD